MSKETARKFISELETNEELRAKVYALKEPAEIAKTAAEKGFDVTLDELIEAEKEYKKSAPQRPTQSCPPTNSKLRQAVPAG